MAIYFLSPEWFYNIESGLAIISIIITLLIGLFSFKIYRYTKLKRYFWFTISFLLIAVAFIFKILSGFIIYNRKLEQVKVGIFTVTKEIIKKVEWINVFSYFTYEILMLLAFIIIFILVYKIRKISVIIILVYLTILATVLGASNLLYFHATLSILSFGICYTFFINYLKKKSKTDLVGIVAVAFGMFGISQFILLFMSLHKWVYPVGQSIFLLGFIALLVNYIVISIKSRTKKKTKKRKKKVKK